METANPTPEPAPLQACACGEQHRGEGQPWEYPHGTTSCRIGETWFKRETFELPPRELVRRLEDLGATAKRLEKERDAALGTVDALTRQLEAQREEASDWKGAAVSLARIVSLMERR